MRNEIIILSILFLGILLVSGCTTIPTFTITNFKLSETYSNQYSNWTHVSGNHYRLAFYNDTYSSEFHVSFDIESSRKIENFKSNDFALYWNDKLLYRGHFFDLKTMLLTFSQTHGTCIAMTIYCNTIDDFHSKCQVTEFYGSSSVTKPGIYKIKYIPSREEKESHNLGEEIDVFVLDLIDLSKS